MRRIRPMAVSLAFVLVASACGGGGDGALADPVEDARPDTVVSEAEQQEDAGREASATSEAEPRQDAPSGTSASTEAEPQEAAQADTLAEQVQLGNRSEWCADMEAVWDAFDGARTDLIAAETRHQDAVDGAEEDLRQAQDAHDAAEVVAVRDLVEAHRFYVGDADNDDDDDDTLVVAFARAWEALIAVSPQVREAAAEFEAADMEAHLQHIEKISQHLREVREVYSWPSEMNMLGSAFDYAQGAIARAERAGVNAADITALRGAFNTARSGSFDADHARQLVIIEAEKARQAGVIPSAAAAADAAGDAEYAAERAVKTLTHNTRETAAAYFDAGDAADAGNAEAALAAATTAIGHLEAAYGADDALSDAVTAAEQALYDAQAAQRSPQSVIDAARDAFTAAIFEVSAGIPDEAIAIAEQAGADPAGIATLRDAVKARFIAFLEASDARRASVREAEDTRRDSGAARSSAEIAEDTLQANHAAIAALQTLDSRYYNGIYPAKQNTASAETAEDALAAASTAVEHLLVIVDAYDAWKDAFAAVEIAAEDARVASLPQDVVDASEAAGASPYDARDTFTTSIKEALSDADAYAAFREPIQESCQ